MYKNNKNGKSDSRSNGKSGNFKGKSFNKSKFKKGREDTETKRDDGTNDPKWYQLDEQILRDAGQFSFNNPLGAIVPHITDSTSYRFPGVASILYTPTIGEASDSTSPVNLQAKKLISFLRSKVSNKLDFAAPDIIMYLLAMDSMYSYYAFCVRLYGIHNAYLGMNRYYPEALYEALGVSANATSDWNRFRTWINTWAYQLSQVFVPASITYFQRHMWMNSNVYLDSPDSKAQTYVFSPEYYYKWEGTTDPHGTKLKLTPFPRGQIVDGQVISTKSLDDLMSDGNAMLNNLVSDKDIGELSGLVLRAFGEPNCLKLSTISEDFSIPPVYNPEVMTQIHNATICGSLVTTSGLGDITQDEFDNLSVTYKTTSANGLRYLELDRLLDLEVPNPTIDDTFVATRLMACGVCTDSKKISCTLTQIGSEVVTKVILIRQGEFTILESAAILDNDVAGLKKAAKASAFRSFPYVYVCTPDADTTKPSKVVDLIGDVSNYTTLSNQDVSKIHSAATMSLFAIPTVGTTR